MRKFPCQLKSAYLVTDRLIRKYFCGVDVAEGYLLFDNFGATVFTDARYFSAAKVLFESVGLNTVLFNGLDSIADFIKDKDYECLLLDYTKTTVAEFEEYKSFNLEIKDFSKELNAFRAIKDAEEIQSIKKACDIAQKAYHEAIKIVKEGILEIELKDIIERNMIELGADGPAFETIVAFGENAAVPHHVTGETRLKKNSVILVDMGASVGGYFSDLTRTAFFGNPNKKFKDCYSAVLKANLLAEEKITAGLTTDKADAIARDYLKERNLEEYFTHSLGHGVGIEIHEFPTLSPRKSTVLEENTVFTIEPGVYIDGEFGIRIEDTVVIKNGKVERLFTDSKELIII